MWDLILNTTFLNSIFISLIVGRNHLEQGQFRWDSWSPLRWGYVDCWTASTGTAALEDLDGILNCAWLAGNKANDWPFCRIVSWLVVVRLTHSHTSMYTHIYIVSIPKFYMISLVVTREAICRELLREKESKFRKERESNMIFYQSIVLSFE